LFVFALATLNSYIYFCIVEMAWAAKMAGRFSWAS